MQIHLIVLSSRERERMSLLLMETFHFLFCIWIRRPFSPGIPRKEILNSNLYLSKTARENYSTFSSSLTPRKVKKTQCFVVDCGRKMDSGFCSETRCISLGRRLTTNHHHQKGEECQIDVLAANWTLRGRLPVPQPLSGSYLLEDQMVSDLLTAASLTCC